MAHVEKNVFQSKDQTTLAIVLAAIDELDPGDLVVVADAWARKRDQTSSNTAAAGASARVVPMEDVQAGSTGSQPIESPRVLAHVRRQSGENLGLRWCRQPADARPSRDQDLECARRQ